MTTLPTAVALQGPTDRTLGRDDLAACLPVPVGHTLTVTRCRLDSEDLSGLDARGVHFMDCSLQATRWAKANLAESVWQGCKAGQADFRQVDLTDARFSQCDLNNTSWLRAKLAATRFEASKLTGAGFGGAETLGLVLVECLLVGADLRGLSFRKQRLEQLQMADADVSGCDFRDAVFKGGSLRNAHLKNAQFAGADVRSVDLGGLSLNDLVQSFKGAVISHDQAATLVEALGVRVG